MQIHSTERERESVHVYKREGGSVSVRKCLNDTKPFLEHEALLFCCLLFKCVNYTHPTGASVNSDKQADLHHIRASSLNVCILTKLRYTSTCS